jgi:hypothetical protein
MAASHFYNKIPTHFNRGLDNTGIFVPEMLEIVIGVFASELHQRYYVNFIPGELV